MCLGSAYVFYSADGSTGWTQVSKLVASDGVGNDYFGWSVCVHGSVLAVAAYQDDTTLGVDSGIIIPVKSYVLYHDDGVIVCFIPQGRCMCTPAQTETLGGLSS